MRLDNPDLTTDHLARAAVKDETVTVEFAAASGALVSAVGPNNYRAGDALITGSTGDRWCVCAERWLEAYQAGRVWFGPTDPESNDHGVTP